MSSSARDARYGRRGGGWIDGKPLPAPKPCDVCGGPVTTGGTRHASCTPQASPGPFEQAQLFDPGDGE